MYRSLGEIVGGWTKNVAVGARQSAQGWEAAALPAMLGYLLLFWLLPSGVLLGATARHLVAGSGTGPWTLWSGAATAVGLALWRSAYARFGVPGRYALLYPLGSALVAFIVLRSWVRGKRRIEWKGRTYAAGGRA
jgi:hypothetical protein